MKYNWQREEWPDFLYSLEGLQENLLLFAEKSGRVDGLFAALPESEQVDARIHRMVSEAMKTSEIEGEILNRLDVMSSIKNNLGLNVEPQQVGDQRAEGVAELMVCVRDGFAQPVTQKMLFEWHAMLMKGSPRIQSGTWRKHAEPMLIISGTIGDEQVHYEAPPSIAVPDEMKRFIRWFNHSGKGGEQDLILPAVRAAVAHLYFESIHPLEDGNGRIGRALSEKVLSQGMGHPILLSLSKAIEADRAGYYAALKQAQRSVDITDWIFWFVNMLVHGQEVAEADIEFVLKKTQFFDRIRGQLNDRQLNVLRRMFKEGSGGFKGGMGAKKYGIIAKTSKPTATRDLQDLVERGIFIPFGGGRGTRYEINL